MRAALRTAAGVQRATVSRVRSVPGTDLRKDENAIYRAGAGRLLAGYRSVNLAGALNDESPLVRRAAMALTEQAPRKDPELRQRVIEVLKDFAQDRPDLDATHFALALLFESANDNAQAIESWARYLRINPWDDYAK